MPVQRIVWSSLVDNTMELLRIAEAGEKQISGLVVGVADDRPVSLTYDLKADRDWRLSEVSLIYEGLESFESHLVNQSGKWYDRDHNHIKDFDGADDIDITLTPFTNTLPINRIRLGPGESKEIKVIYFDLTALKVYPARQRYTNVGSGNYRFEHLDTGFVAIIEVDKEGFVVEYPGLFKRVHYLQD